MWRNWKNLERRLTDLVDKKFGNAMKTVCDEVEKTYAAVVAVENTTGKPKRFKNDNSKYHNTNKCIRIQGILEDPTKTKGEILSQQKMNVTICSIR